MPMKKVIRTIALFATLAATQAAAQTFTNLKHPPPDGAGVGFLLTDGTVLFQGSQYGDWWRLTPDNTGSYQAGTWKQAASLPTGYTPLYFASAVLPDGRVIIAGGEYNAGRFAFTNQCAIYDPVANSWTNVAPPAGWDYIGDSPSAVLADGRFLVGRKFDKQMAVLDAATLTWSAVASAGKKDINAEEGWTLLATGRLLTWDVSKSPHTESFDSTAQRWSSAGNTPVSLKGPPYVKVVHYGHGMIYRPPGEVGPGILRPDGTVFATGDTPTGAKQANTAVYHPGAGGAAGSWTAGPIFPTGVSAGDSPAVLLPDGNVLVEGSDNILYEFDGTSLTASPYRGVTYGSLLILPTGEAIVSGDKLYRGAGSANPAWAPAITQSPATIARGSTYPLSGRQFNGLSQAASFGDEVETATNYPLVRVTNIASGHVIYMRTHDHSTMAVATGKAIVSTQFDVPAAAETGPSMLVVVANGIASAPVGVTVQ